MSSFSGKTVASTFKQILQLGSGNTGLTTSLQVVKDGAGNQSALNISDDKVKIQPENDDTTSAFYVLDKDGNALFTVDSTNDYVKALNHQVNTQYVNFGISSANSSGYLVNTHYAIPFGFYAQKASDADLDFGTGTDPDDTFTTANTDTQFASQLVPMIW